MVHLEDAYAAGEVWATVGKGIQPGPQTYILRYAAPHSFVQFILGVPLSHYHDSAVVSDKRLRDFRSRPLGNFRLHRPKSLLQGGLVLDPAESQGQMVLEDLGVIIQDEVGSTRHRRSYSSGTWSSFFHIIPPNP